MIIPIGKYRGKSPERVVLNYPDYVMSVVTQPQLDGALADLASEFRRLIERFDDMPIVVCCREPECGQPATLSTVYHRNYEPYWWCGGCDPIAGKVHTGKLSYVESYLDACEYVAMYCRGEETALKSMVMDIARAKGLPERPREADLVAFFE